MPSIVSSSAAWQALSEHSALSLIILSCLVLLLVRFIVVDETWLRKINRPLLQECNGSRASIPHIKTFLPIVGHALGLQRSSVLHIHKLIRKTAEPIFTFNFLSRKVFVFNPSLERSLAKHVHETGLAQILSVVGKRVFNLSDTTIQFIVNYDPRPQHQHEFLTAYNSQALSKISSNFAFEHISGQSSLQVVDLGQWLFRIGVCSTASSVWGSENPWNLEKGFVDSFCYLAAHLDTLGRPIPSITARRAYKAREFLLDRLAQFHVAHRNKRTNTAAHRINAVTLSDPGWETNPEYFRVELLSALGLLVTPATLMVWLVWHLLTDTPMLEKIVSEVRKLGVVPNDPEDESTVDKPDLQNVTTTCPHLVAAWYETLRLHMTGVPRLARKDFDFSHPYTATTLAMKKGDVMFLPMYSFNMDPETWGPDPGVFSPQRFIDSDGKLSSAQARKVKSFGVAGNLCPGRNFGFDVVVAVLAAVLRKYDISSVARGRIPSPTAASGLSIGFQRYAGDVKVRLMEVQKSDAVNDAGEP